MTTFGIDLGTTTSAIAVVRNATPYIVRIDGAELLPSVVSFPAEGPPVVGQPALNQLALQPERTITSSKRKMGTGHQYPIDARMLTPVDCAEHILRALADAAEAELGERPTRVVITVPAWFTQAQRADTKLAGEQAGLEVARIINEPTAAALAHAHGQADQRTVMVYDFGGGTFDVSLVRQDGLVTEVLASHGDSLLGGDDLDDALVQDVLAHLATEDRPLHTAVAASAGAMTRLRMAVEEAKVALSTVTETVVRVPFLVEVDGVRRHLEHTLRRHHLEGLAEPLIQRSLACVDRVLEDAGDAEVDELQLVGGTTLLPAVWQALHERYGWEGSHAVSPRRAVVLGAALQGAILDGVETAGILVDVAPYSLSAGVISGSSMFGLARYECRVLTPRNTPLPSRHTEVFSTSHALQKELDVEIYQGSDRDPRLNTMLGRVHMPDLPPAPAEKHSRPIRVAFLHDLDGMVSIEVTDELSGRTIQGQVAVDGEAQSSQWEQVLAELLADGLLPETPERKSAKTPATTTETWSEEPAYPEEAKATFSAVLAAEGMLRAEHPSDAEWLLTQATQGQRALEDDEAAGMEIYDQLSDRLFDLGVYL